MTFTRDHLTALIAEFRAALAAFSRNARMRWGAFSEKARAFYANTATERAELAQALTIGASHARRTAWFSTVALLMAGASAAIVATPALVMGSFYSMVEARQERHEQAAGLRERLRESAAALEGVNFIDRFAALNTNRWHVADGWSDGSWHENDWQAEQISVSHHGMAITLDRNGPGAPKLFSSGAMSTYESFQFGYFEVRMRVARGEGLVTGFFTYTRPDGRSTWEEIDIEILGRDTRKLEVAYHLHGRARGRTIDLGFDAADDYHTYAFEWTPDALRWYVDNKMVHEERHPAVQNMRRGQQLFIHMWNSAELYRWVGLIDPAEAPWALNVACIAQSREYTGRSLCEG